MKWDVYGYFFDCDEFEYQGKRVEGLEFEVMVNQNLTDFELDKIGVVISKKTGFSVVVNIKAWSALVQPYKISFLIPDNEEILNPVEIDHDTLMQYAEHIIDGYSSFPESCTEVEDNRTKEMLQTPSFCKVHTYEYDCKPFEFNHMQVKGILCSVKTNADTISELVGFYASEEQGCYIVIDSRAKNVVVQPGDFYLQVEGKDAVTETLLVDAETIEYVSGHIKNNPAAFQSSAPAVNEGYYIF